MNSPLQQVLQRPDVWRPRDRRFIFNATRSHVTGFTELDSELRGGWPCAALTELLTSQSGIGELSLLTPLLADLSQKQLLNVWINPPFIPYAPALAQHGIALDTLLIVRGEAKHHLWACEQALRSAACGAVLFWPAKPLRYAELRKLQVAAATQNAMGFLFRDTRVAQQTSPAALRLQLNAADSPLGAQLTIRILKQRGQAGGKELLLPRDKTLQSASLFTEEFLSETASIGNSLPAAQFSSRHGLKIIAASQRKNRQPIITSSALPLAAAQR